MTAHIDPGHVMTREHYEGLAREAAAEPAAPRQHPARPALVNLSGPELIARHAGRFGGIGVPVATQTAAETDQPAA